MSNGEPRLILNVISNAITMIALEKKPPATKCSDHCTISLTTKIAAKILRRRIERKVEDVLGEDQFGFRREKELWMQLGC
jgi:hypothetical protein